MDWPPGPAHDARHRSGAGEVVVRTRALTKRYGRRVAVDDLNLEVRRGEVFGLVGPNGAGKTTTIRMLLGLVAPTSGAVELLGHNLAAHGEAALPHVGALVEAPAVYPYLSGRENLRAAAEVFGPVPERRLDRVLELVGLAPRQGDRASMYSLGMKQRLSVGMALVCDPELLLFDEPMSGLDPIGRRAFLNLVVGELAASGKTVVLSSHILPDVEAVVDHIGILRDGRLVVCDELDALRQRHARVRLAFAEPPSGETLAALEPVPGVTGMKCEGRSVRVRIHGDVAAALVALQACSPPPVTVDTTYLTLDDIFLAYMPDEEQAQ